MLILRFLNYDSKLYIHIAIHRQIVAFYQDSSVMDRHVGRTKPGSKPIQIYVRLSLRPLGEQAYHVWQREFLRFYLVTAAAVCLHFYTLSATYTCVCKFVTEFVETIKKITYTSTHFLLSFSKTLFFSYLFVKIVLH